MYAVIASTPKGTTMVCEVFQTEAEAEASKAEREVRYPAWSYTVEMVVEAPQMKDCYGIKGLDAL